MKIRILATIALVVLIAGTALLWRPATGETLDDGRVNITALPTRNFDCRPCHMEITQSDVRGLAFNHQEHPPADCVACHVRPAHEADRTYRPVMQTCFACHGMLHGPQLVMASGTCSTCHTPEHTLRPASHVETWAAEPHAATSELIGVNNCMMCHAAATDCDACHADQVPEVGPMPSLYLRLLPEEPVLPEVWVDTTEQVTMSQCAYCHATVDETRDERIIFPHDPHLERDHDCAACHEVFPHQRDLTVVPDMLSCYRCHGLTHAAQGEVATEDCSACHPPAFNLVPADHTTAFMSGVHTRTAEASMESCTMCHTSTFCTDCHVGGAQMADGRVSESVIPEAHYAREWIPDHGQDFLGQRGACSICHTSQSCEMCHTTSMPHQPAWLSQHAVQSAQPLADDCNVCHTDRSWCQDCHHEAVADLELLRENCVDCHVEMETEPATQIDDARLAEHAVHFNVQERVGRPYVCDDCHTQFQTRPIPGPAAPAQAHDVRLCYECHGNLGIDNLLIAPYPGSELCRRCHDDLRL